VEELGNRVQRVDFEHVRPQLFGPSSSWVGTTPAIGPNGELLAGAPRFRWPARRTATPSLVRRRGDAQRQRTPKPKPAWKSGDRPGHRLTISSKSRPTVAEKVPCSCRRPKVPSHEPPDRSRGARRSGSSPPLTSMPIIRATRARGQHVVPGPRVRRRDSQSSMTRRRQLLGASS